jgi:hypothetical protein
MARLGRRQLAEMRQAWVSKEEIEAVLMDRYTRVFPDPAHGGEEIREIAVGVPPIDGHAMATTVECPVHAWQGVPEYEQTHSR